MTPEQERALLDATARGLDADLKAAYQRLTELIRAGIVPRDAVEAVMQTFTGQYEALLSQAFSAIMAASVGTAAVQQLEVGAVQLSRKLYAQSQQTAAVVQGIVDRHAKGFQDARRLTLELFEGYDFREAEPLNLKRGNQTLPKYLREELLYDPGLAGDLQRYFSRLQAESLKTPALRASYQELLDAIEEGAGARVLDNKLRVAFFEKMRYFANRIAQTELHRAYAQREALMLLDDKDVEYVQWRMSPNHPEVDICDYFAGLDRYGLGKGVYPKKLAPVAPAHPHCRCVLRPRLDIRLGTKAKENPDADGAYIRSLGGDGALVMGSRAKLDQVLRGAKPLDVHNATIDPAYRVKLAGQLTG